MNRSHSAILGALVGDALGVPFEFKAGHNIPADIDIVMPAAFPRSHGSVPYGCWSDDGAQLLCLMDALLARPEVLDIDAFARLLVSWYTKAYHQSGGVVFDCGLATGSALRRLRSNTPPLESGHREDNSNGNGSLMRTLPVAIAAVHYGHDEQWVIDNAILQSMPTHAHEKSLATCATYSLIAYTMLRGEAPEIEKCFDEITRYHPESSTAVEKLRNYGKTEIPNGSGYVFNTFWSAWHCLEQANSYQEAVERAVKLGNDTDTTACVTGGLAGIRWGIGGTNGIPERWIAQLHIPDESECVLAAVKTFA